LRRNGQLHCIIGALPFSNFILNLEKGYGIPLTIKVNSYGAIASEEFKHQTEVSLFIDQKFIDLQIWSERIIYSLFKEL
jgi:hypothetical protein